MQHPSAERVKRMCCISVSKTIREKCMLLKADVERTQASASGSEPRGICSTQSSENRS
jgi:hypothetical protein